MVEKPRLLKVVSVLTLPQFLDLIESGEPVVIELHIYPEEVNARAYPPRYHNEALPPPAAAA